MLSSRPTGSLLAPLIKALPETPTLRFPVAPISPLTRYLHSLFTPIGNVAARFADRLLPCGCSAVQCALSGVRLVRVIPDNHFVLIIRLTRLFGVFCPELPTVTV